MPRRLVRALLFAAAAAVTAWAAWPQPGVGHAAVSQFHVIATVLLLAGLPLLARRFFGPPSPSRAGRSLRVLCCAAILALLPGLYIVETFANLTPARPAYRYTFCIAQGWSNIQGCNGVLGRSTGGPAWAGEIPLLLMTIAYLGVILFLTSRRSQVTRGTLAIGAGTGLLFGVVMYAVAPLGLSNDATDPWLPGSAADPLVALAWILLIGGPAAAAVLAAWRGRGPGGAALPRNVRFGQGIAAGVLANGTAALFVSALGFGTTALMLRSAWLLRWLNHGQHLTAIAAYRYEIGARRGHDRVSLHADLVPGHRADHERARCGLRPARPPRARGADPGPRPRPVTRVSSKSRTGPGSLATPCRWGRTGGGCTPGRRPRRGWRHPACRGCWTRARWPSWAR